MRSETQPYCNIRLCRTAYSIFSPKFWNDKMNFTRVFVTVSPRRPWDRGWDSIGLLRNSVWSQSMTVGGCRLLPNEMAAGQVCNFVWENEYRLFANILSRSVVFLYGKLWGSLSLNMVKISGQLKMLREADVSWTCFGDISLQRTDRLKLKRWVSSFTCDRQVSLIYFPARHGLYLFLLLLKYEFELCEIDICCHGFVRIWHDTFLILFGGKIYEFKNVCKVSNTKVCR